MPRSGARAPLVVAVEGIIGAGKTELASALAARLRACGFRVVLDLEPVAQWEASGILRKFYEDPARYAYTFQTFVFASRVLSIRAAIAAQVDADVIILERTPVTNQLFMELMRGTVSDVEMALYKTWCDTYSLLLPFDCADVRVVYLRPSLGACMARVAHRGRGGEVADDGKAPAAPPDALLDAPAAAPDALLDAPAAAPDAPAKPASGVTAEYQTRLAAVHDAFFLGEGESPIRNPYRAEHVFEIPPYIADLDFRAGDVQDSVLANITRWMGLGVFEK